MFNENFSGASSFREYAGGRHFMNQAYRKYDFPVNVYQEDENGVRTLLRVETSGS